MKPVGDLDEDDADVLGHGHEHLADVLHLLVFDAGILYARQLGDALNDVGNGRPERAGDVGMGQISIFDHVMQQRSDDRILVKPHVHRDVGSRDAVRHIGRAAVLAQLPRMCAARHLIGRADAVKVDAVAVGADLFLQLGIHLVRVKRCALQLFSFGFFLHGCYPQIDFSARMISVFSRSALPSISAFSAP